MDPSSPCCAAGAAVTDEELRTVRVAASRLEVLASHFSLADAAALRSIAADLRTLAPATLPPPKLADAPIWLAYAYAELGQREVAGARDNPRILEYLRAVAGTWEHDETPWCSAFVNWVMQRAAFTGTGRANARSWLSWGRPLDTPTHGCVVVFERGDSPHNGHVAFYLESNATLDAIKVLGGNQGNRVSEQWYPASRVLGYRVPT